MRQDGKNQAKCGRMDKTEQNEAGREKPSKTRPEKPNLAKRGRMEKTEQNEARWEKPSK